MERSLDTVARFFLSDCDVPEILPPEAGPGEVGIKKDEEKTAPDKCPGVCVMLGPDELASQASFLGRMLVLCLAASDISVGFIETTTRLPHPFFLSGGYENLDAVFWESGLDSPDFLNVISRFEKACDFVLINTSASALLKTNGPTKLMGRFLVPTTIRPQDLLSAYGIIKNVSKGRAVAEIEFVVIKRQPKDNAAGAAAVLEEMASKFLPCSVRFIGTVTLPEDAAASGSLTSRPSLQTLPDAAAAAVKEIARHLIVSGDPQEKREPYVEKRL